VVGVIGKTSMTKVEFTDHGLGETGGPFHDLGANIAHEGSRSPAAKNHNFNNRFICEEKGHCGPRAERVGADLMGLVAKDLFPAPRNTGGAEDSDNIALVYIPWCWLGILHGIKPTICRSFGWCIWEIVQDAPDHPAPR
jgi:hypothetical protein